MHPRKLVKTMKRIKELTVFALILLLVAGVFAEYAVTASAPTVRAEIEVAPAEPAEKASRGSFVDQVIKTTSLFFKSDAAANESLADLVEHAKMDVPVVSDLTNEPQP